MKHIIVSLFILFAFQVYGGSPIGSKGGPSAETKLETAFMLSGSVMDIETGEKLAGSKIEIEETGISVFTDMEGNFSIEQLLPGNYTLKVSYISYEEKKMTSQISEGQDLSIAIKPL